MLIPGTPAPDLRFDTVRHGVFDVAVDPPPGGTLVSFHRGWHCKWTRRALQEFDDRIGDFALRGIRIVCVSGDGAAAAAQYADELQLIRLPIGHSADVATIGAAWRLFMTRASTEEGAPALHWEPAQIWVRSDNTIGSVAVQSGPNLWADATNMIRAIENTMNKYPERGAGGAGTQGGTT
ncbi:MAG: redoxin domain-containing protein [Maritimibacter sp.]|nr:redoxin domain-containing protein [Maritimibacter sp.]